VKEKRRKKMKTRKDFLNDCKRENARVKKLLDYGMTWDQVLNTDPEKTRGRTQRLYQHMNNYRKIDKVKTNEIVIEGSYFTIPRASLMEYNGTILTTYSPGYRPLNDEEKRVMEEYRKMTSQEEYQRQSHYDMISDGSTTFYQEKRFFQEKGMEYLQGIEKNGRKRVTYYYTQNDNIIESDFIYDPDIKGQKIFQYEIKWN
jgi:hypothetical protein